MFGVQEGKNWNFTKTILSCARLESRNRHFLPIFPLKTFRVSFCAIGIVPKYTHTHTHINRLHILCWHFIILHNITHYCSRFDSFPLVVINILNKNTKKKNTRRKNDSYVQVSVYPIRLPGDLEALRQILYLN